MKANTKSFSNGRKLFLLMVSLFIIGGIFHFLYQSSALRSIPVKSITHTIQSKSSQIDEQIKDIKTHLKKNEIKGLSELLKQDNYFFIYEEDNLIFWTTNRIVPQNTKEKSWQYSLVPNLHTLVCSDTVGKYNIVAYIPLKYNFPYENKMLENVFLSGISLNKEVEIQIGSGTEENSIYSLKGDYLFSLKIPNEVIYNETFSIIAFFCFSVAFILLLFLFSNLPIWFGRNSISLKEFFIVNLIAIGVFFILLRFDIPSTFFSNKLFSPYQYSGSFLLRTLIHLSFVSLFFMADIILLGFYVKDGKTDEKKIYFYLETIILLLIPFLVFFVIRSFFYNIILNSSIEIDYFQFMCPNLYIIWVHLLFWIWGVSFLLIFITTHKCVLRVIPIKKVVVIDIVLFFIETIFLFYLFKNIELFNIYALLVCYFILYLHLLFKDFLYEKRLLALWLFFFMGLYIFNFNNIYEKKKIDNYKVLVKNEYLLNKKNDDKITTYLFQDLQKELERDKNLYELIHSYNSARTSNIYLKNTFLKNFSKKYDIYLSVFDKVDDLYKEYNHLIEAYGVKIGTTDFYKIKEKEGGDNLSYLGKFALSSHTHVFLEFYLKNDFKNYGITRFLEEEKSNPNISTAIYYNKKLKSIKGEYNYPESSNWIGTSNKTFYQIKNSNYNHYIYTPNSEECFIISEKNNESFFFFWFNYIYHFFMFFVLTLILIWIYKRIREPKHSKLKFVKKYFYSFISIMVVGFLFILGFTIFYLQGKYKEEKYNEVKQAEIYIKKYLEQKYYQLKELDNDKYEMLANDLDFLSYMFQTDIHIYNSKGRLISSSTPVLFETNLNSENLSPIPLNYQDNTIYVYEKIVNLKYITTYSRFYNKDFIELGYIAIPFFFSENLLENNAEQFVFIILQAHLLLIVLLILFTLLITKNLSTPLLFLQKNIKQIRLGKRNKRITYKPNDEIGQLVDEYNKTVKELENSVEMLMEMERESAWRIMAQQIAHEINNPLTPIRLTIQKLQLVKKTKPEQFDKIFAKDANIIIEQIDNLRRIVKSFSDFSKKEKIEYERINIVEKIESITILFRKNEKNVKIIYDTPKEDIFIISNADRITQALNNLIKNAIQAIPDSKQGYINIYLNKSEEYLAIFVKDNGIGISKRNQKNLFQPKFTTKKSGMGLGLSITKNIIESIGGTISFESNSKGTIFKITLPLN